MPDLPVDSSTLPSEHVIAGRRFRVWQRPQGSADDEAWVSSNWTGYTVPAASDPIVAMYYPGYARWDNGEAGDAPIEDLHWDAFTTIIDFSVSFHDGAVSATWTPDWDTSIDTATNWWSAAQASQLTAEAHSRGKKCLLCVGSAQTSYSFNQNLDTAAKRATLAADLADWVALYGYDGVDLDGEPGNLITNYRAFWQAVLAEFASRGWRTPGDPDYKTVSLVSISSDTTLMRQAIVDGIDWVSPMTYTPWEQTISRHISPLAGPVQGWAETVTALTTGGVDPITDKSKILPGLSFYTYRYGNVTGPNETGATTLWEPQVNNPSGDIDRNWVDIWVACGNAMPDDATATWYAGADMHGKVIDGKWHSFESQKSLDAKAAFVEDNDLGGVVVWMYQHGVVSPTEHPLADALASAFGSEPSRYLNEDFYGQWDNSGMLADPDVFPIACWHSAYAYAVDSAWNVGSPGDFPRAMAYFGLNLLYAYDMGHTIGSTEAAAFARENIGLIVQQPAHRSYLEANNPALLVGYLWGEEWDMLTPRADYYPSVAAGEYTTYQTADPSRPIIVNWGKGMGKPGWTGYQAEVSYAADMAAYQATTDGTCSDVYGWTDPWEDVDGAYYYGAAVNNQRLYAGENVPVWQFVEASRPWNSSQAGGSANETNLIQPDEMESAVWNIICNGGVGVCWFLQDMYGGQWSGPLESRSQFEAQGLRLKAINERLQPMARVLNSKPLGSMDASGRIDPSAYLGVSSSNSIPIDVSVRREAGETWVFAQASGDASNPTSGSCTGTFTWQIGGDRTVTVDGESRTVSMTGGVFTDTFTAYQCHIYRWAD